MLGGREGKEGRGGEEGGGRKKGKEFEDGRGRRRKRLSLHKGEYQPVTPA